MQIFLKVLKKIVSALLSRWRRQSDPKWIDTISQPTTEQKTKPRTVSQTPALRKGFNRLDMTRLGILAEKLTYLPDLGEECEEIKRIWSCVETFNKSGGSGETEDYRSRFRSTLSENWGSFSTFLILVEYLRTYYSSEHTQGMNVGRTIEDLEFINRELHKLFQDAEFVPDPISLFNTKYDKAHHEEATSYHLARNPLLQDSFVAKSANPDNEGTICEIHFWGYTSKDGEKRLSRVLPFDPKQWRP
jgi:hypothetical protein